MNVTYRVITRFYYSHIKIKYPTPGGHGFRQAGTIFKLFPDTIETNLLTKFHLDQTINVASTENAPPHCGHVFQATGTIFELVQDIFNTVKKKNAPPPGDHVFQPTKTIFELVHDIVETNLLTKFHEDCTINVASIVLTRQMLTPHNALWTKSDHIRSP
ncbi:hypothetical protein DPMN_182270 [Dreissena polymorpha]|uniref:Uncharacterized protein n=1 Tax=Dreissena polymorpha TaxID=45954 RepID=A0A9D4DFH4_DREPO|nr:hypothetical protein DPMN_182270 [Dreissena polymorpha]